MQRKIIIALLAVIALTIGYNYVYQDHRDIKSENAAFFVTSSEIAELFSKDAKSAERNFLNKTIEVSGIISEVSANEVTIDDKVFCQFSSHSELELNKDDTVKIKGRVIGYDDLLEQVKLDQCSIIK